MVANRGLPSKLPEGQIDAAFRHVLSSAWRVMAQNFQHWLLDRDRFSWAREHVATRKWVQIRKYFPGERLRRQMIYVDAETGAPIPAEGGEEVPAGKVYIYGYDLQNFCGLEVPGLEEAMTATPKSRVQSRTAPGAASAPPVPAVSPAPAVSPDGQTPPPATATE